MEGNEFQASEGGFAENLLMLEDLEKIKNGEMKATITHKRFMNHELTEKALMEKGLDYKDAHKESMIKWQTNEAEHYTPEAEAAGDAQLMRETRSKPE